VNLINIYSAIFVVLLLAGCQNTSTGGVSAPVSGRVSSPEELRQYEIAVRAMKVHCASKWSGDADMIAYCEKTQKPALTKFIKSKVLFETSNKRTNGAAWKAQVAYYSKCQTTYWGDYEMALACADNERQVNILARSS